MSSISCVVAPRSRRYRPKLRYELIGCALNGHELLGTDAAGLRPQDSLFAREFGGLRWYRCLRCDSWLALTPPAQPARAARRVLRRWANAASTIVKTSARSIMTRRCCQPSGNFSRITAWITRLNAW